MVVVITRVPVRPGQIDVVRDLFEETNPALVAGHPEWIEAKFTANHEDDSITVLAFWENAAGYRALSGSDEFKSVMARFAPYFTDPPEVRVNEILFEMARG